MGWRFAFFAAPVFFFADTFANYHEPAIGEAAVDLLRRAGGSLTLGTSGLRCCGRPMISNGLLDVAVAHRDIDKRPRGS